MRKARTWLVGVVIAVLGGAAAQVAHAEEPLDLDAQVTDQVEAVGEDGAEVQTAVDRLRTEHGQRLYVVYVDDFSGWDAQEWADETATRNELTVNDALLAVATKERVYALSVDSDFPLTSRDAVDIEEVAIEPALRASDWAAAAVAAAEGLGDVRDGNEVRPPDIEQTPVPVSEGSGATVWVVVAVGVVLVAMVAAAAWWWLRRRRASATVQGHP